MPDRKATLTSEQSYCEIDRLSLVDTIPAMHASAPKTTLKDAPETPVLPRIADIRLNGSSSAKFGADGSLENGSRLHLSNKVIPTARKW